MGQPLRGNTINQASAEKIASAGLDGKELFTIDAGTTSDCVRDPLLPPHDFLHPGEGCQMEVRPRQNGQSYWADLNRRHHPYQLPWQYFLHIFRLFIAVFAPFHLLSDTL